MSSGREGTEGGSLLGEEAHCWVRTPNLIAAFFCM